MQKKQELEPMTKHRRTPLALAAAAAEHPDLFGNASKPTPPTKKKGR